MECRSVGLFQLLRPDGRCYNGAAFVVGPCAAQPMTVFFGRYYLLTRSVPQIRAR